MGVPASPSRAHEPDPSVPALRVSPANAWPCGHPKTEENTKSVRNRTGRVCRTCFRAMDAAYRQRKRSEIPPCPPCDDCGAEMVQTAPFTWECGQDCQGSPTFAAAMLPDEIAFVGTLSRSWSRLGVRRGQHIRKLAIIAKYPEVFERRWSGDCNRYRLSYFGSLVKDAAQAIEARRAETGTGSVHEWRGGEANRPFLSLIDDLLSIETPNMRWLRQHGPIAKALNEQATQDRKDENHGC